MWGGGGGGKSGVEWFIKSYTREQSGISKKIRMLGAGAGAGASAFRVCCLCLVCCDERTVRLFAKSETASERPKIPTH